MLLVKLINKSNAVTARRVICIHCLCVSTCHGMWLPLLMQQCLGADQTAWHTQALYCSDQACGFSCTAWNTQLRVLKHLNFQPLLHYFCFVTESVLPEHVHDSERDLTHPLLRDKLRCSKRPVPSAPSWFPMVKKSRHMGCRNPWCAQNKSASRILGNQGS